MANDQSLTAVISQAQQRNLSTDLSGIFCNSCRHMNDSGASFCEECGCPLQMKKICPFCGVQMFGTKNLCEFCGEWLLLGKCKYCEADVEDGQSFCGNCGKMSSNIQCPCCGDKSAFDICISCGTFLTPAAKEVLIGHDIKSAFSAEPDSLPILENLIPSSHVEDQLMLKQYTKKSKSIIGPKIKSSRIGSLFNHKQKDSIEQLAKEAEVEEKRLEEARLKKEEEDRQRQEERKRTALMAKAEGTIYVKSSNVTITVKNEDGIADDKYWLWVNNDKIGYINYNTGGRVLYPAQFVKGINLVELRFDKASGVGTVASITIDPDGQERRYGGSSSHLWMVVAT